MICIDCGSLALTNSELCENCLGTTNSSEMLNMNMVQQRSMSMDCAYCQGEIRSESKPCNSCRKVYHANCDSSETQFLNGFVCFQCHGRPQILSDDMLLSSSAARDQNAPLSPFSDPSVQQMGLQMPSSSMTSNYPSNPDFSVDMRSDGGATNDSDRNNSPFFQDTTDSDEDFVPMNSRGRGRGGKKKPGRGQSTNSRRILVQLDFSQQSKQEQE